MAMSLARCQPLAELIHVQPNFRIRVEGGRLSIDRQKPPSEGAVQLCKGYAQVSASARLVLFWPEQRRQGITTVAAARHSQIRQEGHDFAPAYVHWLAA
jgi:hypothetical protein